MQKLHVDYNKNLVLKDWLKFLIAIPNQDFVITVCDKWPRSCHPWNSNAWTKLDVKGIKAEICLRIVFFVSITTVPLHEIKLSELQLHLR